jgi:hypothetical protein
LIIYTHLCTGSKEKFWLLRGKSLEVSSQKIEAYRPFGTNLLFMALNV